MTFAPKIERVDFFFNMFTFDHFLVFWLHFSYFLLSFVFTLNFSKHGCNGTTHMHRNPGGCRRAPMLLIRCRLAKWGNSPVASGHSHSCEPPRCCGSELTAPGFNHKFLLHRNYSAGEVTILQLRRIYRQELQGIS